MSAGNSPLSLGKAWIFSAATGFLALGWELVWTRLYNFTTASRAIAFGAMLGSYLLGLALGSLLSRRWHHLKAMEAGALAQLALLIRKAHFFCFLIAPVVSWLVLFMPWQWTLLLVVAGSASLGVILPMLCHWAVPPDDRAGQRVAGIYLANIIGSGAGSLLTGFLFLDWLPLSTYSVLLLLSACGLSWWIAGGEMRLRTLTLYFAVAAAAYFMGFGGFYERLQYKNKYTMGMRFAQVIESKHGVVTVDTNGTIYGNGAYDGSFDTSLHPGAWLVRPYFISALHPQPRRVLVIGVSGGAWTQILANHPDVEEVIGVEISDAYLRIIAQYPSVSSLLTNPKVHFVIDDGRRWLRHYPQDKFDLVIMNTTHHWREFASALLSREFLQLVKGHLNPGGLAAWNCTESARATKTGMDVFPYTMMLYNFCVGSEGPLLPDKSRWRDVLQRWRLDGRPVVDTSTPAGQKELEDLAAFADLEAPFDREHRWCWINRSHMEQAWGTAEPITEDNLGHEFQWGNW